MNLLENETTIRSFVFIGGLTLFWLLGVAFSFRRGVETSSSRWFHNISLTLINTLLVRILTPLSLVSLAILMEQKSLGLFYFLNLPYLVNALFAFFIFDCAIYFQHIVFHRFHWLWRLHQVHHSDIGFDVTTALRFHPIEIILSVAFKAVLITTFGFNATGVIVFEILLNFSAMFNHGNFSLPLTIERIVRKFVVTPDMHRIHHSVIVAETNSNFGFFLPWWDYFFKTYRPQSSVDLKSGLIGVESFRDQKEQRLVRLLIQPFTKSTDTSTVDP